MKKLLSLLLALTLCMGLAIPAFAAEEEAPAAAAEQQIIVRDQTYGAFLQALMAQTEDVPLTMKLGSDIQMASAAIVFGASDYGGLMGGTVITVVPQGHHHRPERLHCDRREGLRRL